MHLWCSLGEWVGRCKHPKYRSSTRPSCLIVLVATAAAAATTTTTTTTTFLLCIMMINYFVV